MSKHKRVLIVEKLRRLMVVIGLTAASLPAYAAENSTKMPSKLETATFAAGCFWHVEDSFQHIKGVKTAVSGYTGGTTKNPSYQQVCSGATHHAEAVEVTYDPALVSYGELLNAFWQSHDPTTMNAQGPDHGEQYRSAIFYHSPAQRDAAIASEKKLVDSGKIHGKIVTLIEPAGPFYTAEEYHQDYFAKHGAGFCGLHF